MRRSWWFGLLSLAAVALQAQPSTTLTSVSAGAPAAAANMASARRVELPPVLDGKDDDGAWQQASVIRDFLEYEPREGADTRFRTEARVVYDDRSIYVLVRMFDPAPDSIVSLLARRDVRAASEQVKIVLDSYHDRRTAFQFCVNPAGVKRDFYVYNDNIEDASWDGVWDVATAIDSAGWVAEFRIPFSQLRFPEQDTHTFGLMIVRDVARTNERISWPLFRRNVQGYVSQLGTITGLQGIPAPRRLEMTPYVVTRNVTQASADDFGRRQEQTLGADLKYGLTSNMTLNLAVNPDFGQVESDPAVLNLSTAEVLFAERRPFFLEGSDIFNYTVRCGDVVWDCTGLFYSRRVGRAPQLFSEYAEGNNAAGSTILGAAKVTGRLARGLSLGVMNAVTQQEEAPGGATIEPLTNYLAARAFQDWRNGNSGLGIMATAVNRSLDEFTSAFLRRDAYAVGVDTRHRFWSNNYELSASASFSEVSGSAEAIARTQLEPVHNYQSPDAPGDYDPERTSLSGDSQRLSFGKFGGGSTRFHVGYYRTSPGFEINDVGFVERADEQRFENWFAFQLNTPGAIHRRANFNFNHWAFWNSHGLPIAAAFNFNGHVQFHNQWWAHLGGTWNNYRTTFSDREARGGPAMRRSQGGDSFVGVEGDGRNKIIPSLFLSMNWGDEGKTHGWNLNPTVQVRAASNVNASIGINYRRSINAKQWRANYGEVTSDTTHFTFARLNQTTMSVTGRFDYTISPTLSVQVYAQPFISTGEYSNWRELADPRAERLADRFVPYTAGGDPGGFNFKQFRSNSVLRWEYRPGSTIFLVWSQGRDEFRSEASEFRFRRDYSDMFSLHPDNTLLLKASFWINP